MALDSQQVAHQGRGFQLGGAFAEPVPVGAYVVGGAQVLGEFLGEGEDVMHHGGGAEVTASIGPS